MADLLPFLSREGKRRRLIRGWRHFYEEVLFQEDNAEGSRKLQKGGPGQRMRKRWNKRPDNGLSKNIGAEKSLWAYVVSV